MHNLAKFANKLYPSLQLCFKRRKTISFKKSPKYFSMNKYEDYYIDTKHESSKTKKKLRGHKNTWDRIDKHHPSPQYYG